MCEEIKESVSRMTKDDCNVQYNCVSGYQIDAEGAYKIGDEIEGIGPVQYISTCDYIEDIIC